MAQNRGGDNHQYSSDSSRDIIAYIIDPGSNHAKIAIAFIAIGDHRIHRIDSPIKKCQRHAAQPGKKQWRHNSVDNIFGHGFHCGPGDFPFTQIVGIATDNHPYLALRIRDIAGQNPPADLQTGLRQTARRDGKGQ